MNFCVCQTASLPCCASSYEVIELTGHWPEQVTVCLITMLPKGAGLRPGKLRPITVMSIVYRAWAVIRVRELIPWQDQWLHHGATGFRRIMGCDDVYWDTAAQVESALLSGEPLCGASMDFSKAFDRIPREIVFHLAEIAGMPQSVLTALAGMYTQNSRRFRLPGNFVSSNSFGGDKWGATGLPHLSYPHERAHARVVLGHRTRN